MAQTLSMLQNQPTYGNDANGVICAYIFEDKKRTELVGEEIAACYNHMPVHSFLWIHINLASANTLKWLKTNFEIADEYYEELVENTTSTKIELVDDNLIAVINDVLYDFNFENLETSTLYTYVTPKLVVTARIKPLRSIDNLRIAVKKGEVLTSSIALLGHLLQDQADVLYDIARNLSKQTDKIEDHIIDDNLTSDRAELGSMRRVLVRLQRLLAPEPAALFRLLNRPPIWVTSDDQQILREASEEFASVIGDAQSLQERIKLLQEELAAQVNEQTNNSVYVLTMLSVLALPLNIIAGLFGMNVGGIPLSTNPQGFTIIISSLLVFCAIALYFLNQYRKQRRK